MTDGDRDGCIWSRLFEPTLHARMSSSNETPFVIERIHMVKDHKDLQIVFLPSIYTPKGSEKVVSGHMYMSPWITHAFTPEE